MSVQVVWERLLGRKPNKRVWLETNYGVTYECCQYPRDEFAHRVFDDRGDFEAFFMALDGCVPKFEDEWRTASEGSWTFADDGRVLQILRRRTIKHQSDTANYQFSKNGYVMTTVGTFVCTKHYTMDTDFSIHPHRSSFATEKKSTRERIRDRTIPTKNELEFVMNLIRGDKILTAYKKVFKVSNPKTALSNSTFLLRQDRILRLLKDKLDNTAAELDIDVKYIMTGIKTMADAPKTPATVRLEAFTRLGRYIGMEDETVTSGIPLTGYNEQKQQLGEHRGEVIELGRPRGEVFNPDEIEVEQEHVIDSVTGDQV